MRALCISFLIVAIDFNSPHGSSLRAAANALENPVRGGWLKSSVSGLRLGMMVTFRDKMQGWQVAAVGIETTPSFEIRRAPRANEDAAFGVRFKTMGNPASKEILTPELRARIVDLGPSQITLHRGTLTLVKKYYQFYYVERAKIEEAICLATELLLAAQRVCPTSTRPAQLPSGAPYRQSPRALDQDREALRDALFPQRQLAPRKSHRIQATSRSLWVAPLVLARRVGSHVLSPWRPLKSAWRRFFFR